MILLELLKVLTLKRKDPEQQLVKAIFDQIPNFHNAKQAYSQNLHPYWALISNRLVLVLDIQGSRFDQIILVHLVVDTQNFSDHQKYLSSWYPNQVILLKFKAPKPLKLLIPLVPRWQLGLLWSLALILILL